jgi:hypothetical protein
MPNILKYVQKEWSAIVRAPVILLVTLSFGVSIGWWLTARVGIATRDAYSKLTNAELKDRSTELVKKMRVLSQWHTKTLSEIPATDPDFARKLDETTNSMLDEFKTTMSAETLSIERELLRRLSPPRYQSDLSQIAPLLLHSGNMAGSDPVGTIASYIEELAMLLPLS